MDNSSHFTLYFSFQSYNSIWFSRLWRHLTITTTMKYFKFFSVMAFLFNLVWWAEGGPPSRLVVVSRNFCWRALEKLLLSNLQYLFSLDKSYLDVIMAVLDPPWFIMREDCDRCDWDLFCEVRSVRLEDKKWVELYCRASDWFSLCCLAAWELLGEPHYATPTIQHELVLFILNVSFSFC